MIKKFEIKKKNFEDIFNDWSTVKSMNYRDKLKAYRRITFDIKTVYARGIYTPNQLNFFITVLATTKKANLLQNKIITEWLELSGYTQAKILTSKRGKIAVKSGTISVFDEYNIPDIDHILNSDSTHYVNSIAAINSGYIYIFHTGEDGDFNAQLRVIDSIEPQVTPKEMKYVSSIGSPYYLQAPSGKLVICDHLGGFPEDGMVLSVEPGIYKLTVFYFNLFPKVSSYYIVLCKVNEVLQNLFDDLDNLAWD